MKTFQITIIFLLLLQAAAAHVAYTCKTQTPPTHKKESLTVESEDCTVTQNERYQDICNVGTSTLMVSSGQLPSMIIASDGSMHKMDCQ